jgi:hypothetical protein
VNGAAEEKLAIAEGFDAQVVDGSLSPELQEAAAESYPKTCCTQAPQRRCDRHAGEGLPREKCGAGVLDV